MHKISGPEASFVLDGNLHNSNSSGIDRAADTFESTNSRNAVVGFSFEHLYAGFAQHSISSASYFGPQIYRC
jgi:hypothetical protein